MILRAETIAKLLQKGRKGSASDPLVITPSPDLNELRQSGSASVDLRLGTWFLTLRAARTTHLDVSAGEAIEARLAKHHYVPFGENYYLHPGSFVLGGTLEWLRLPKDLSAYVIGRSSWGRRGLIIATATGVHPGFKGCLTLELSNVGELPIAIKPGMAICQLCLHRAEDVATEYLDSSSFVGLRKPILGRIKIDDIARRLSEPYPPSPSSP